MRISTVQAYNNGVAGLQRNYANVTRTQEQISTGNRILTAADDPVASVRLTQLEQQQAVLGQYNDNLVAAKNSLTQEEVTLNSVNTVLQRVRELAVQAGNGALDPQDRKSIAAELAEREDELLGLMNTRNARGEYIFSGFQGKTEPFVRQGDGTYLYAGDEGQRQLQIASSLTVPISDNGKKLFENVTNAGRLSATATPADLSASSLRLSAPLVSDEVAFAGLGGINITFAASPNERSYTVTDAGGNTLGSGSLDDDPDTDDKLVFGGVTLYVAGNPSPSGETIALGETGDQKRGILDSIARLRQGLENGSASAGEVRDSVALALTNLDHGMVKVDAVRGEIGARLNVIETTQIDNEDVTLVNQSVQAELRELDYAEALSRLSFQSVVLEAAQQSYVKVSSLSLFNLL